MFRPKYLTRWIQLAFHEAKKPQTPFQMGLAFSVGVFSGCLPFLGFRAMMAIGLALLFRLNAFYAWLGTHVANPFVYPFIAAGAFLVGKLMFGSVSTVGGIAANFLVGSVVLGLGLGITSLGIIWISAFCLKR